MKYLIILLMALSTSCVRLPEIKNKCMYDNVYEVTQYCEAIAESECQTTSLACINVRFSKCTKNILNRKCNSKDWE